MEKFKIKIYFMTVTSTEIFIYITALIILFITPGPVWIAIIARTISGGAKSAYHCFRCLFR